MPDTQRAILFKAYIKILVYDVKATHRTMLTKIVRNTKDNHYRALC